MRPVKPIVWVLITMLFFLGMGMAQSQADIAWQQECPGYVEVRPDAGGQLVTCYLTNPPVTSTPTPSRTATPTASSTPTPAIQPGTYLEAFDGVPAAPQPLRPSSRLDVVIHSRDTWYNLDPMQADHGEGCTPPPAQHSHNSYEGAVFNCVNHMMTAINASGYGELCLMPAAQVDFSQGEAVVSWRMSTFRTSPDRDWVDIWLTPFPNYLKLPLQGFFPDLQGPPRYAILVRMQTNRNSFEVFRYENFISTRIGGGLIGYESVLTPSRIVRDLFEIRLSGGQVKVWMPERNITFVNKPTGSPLTWSSGVVQFCHHSYNPYKDGDLGPNTYHWDDLFISPALPLTIIPSDRRYYRADLPTVTLDSPAPANAFLAFSGIGSNLELSFNGGLTWTPALRQPAGNAYNGGHFATFLTPIPEGTIVVMIRGLPWWGGGWHARDATVIAP